MPNSRRRRSYGPNRWRGRLRNGIPYTSRRTLLSRGEFAFYHALMLALNGRCFVSLKTRLADILHCPKTLWDQPHGRRLSQKHVDFVLHCPNTSRILGVIELDDVSHDRPDRRQRDRFVRRALAEAGIPFLRVRAAVSYPIDNLRDQLQSIFNTHQSRRRISKCRKSGDNAGSIRLKSREQ